MSFVFEWPRFSDEFHANAIELLNNALNKGNKPPVIADRIEVVELEMGTQPPELEIRDIGDLTVNQFRGIFRLTYAGDAHIVLRTKVQANPLYHKKPDIHLMGGSRGMLAANQPLVVPMLLRLSNFKLNSYVVLVVSKQKGITLVFKTDPLQNVDISSTFDSFTVIQQFIQKEIEGQLRQMFREDLPGIIHRLSQQWIKKSTTVEAPYLRKQPVVQRTAPHELDTMSNPEHGRSLPPTQRGLYPGLGHPGLRPLFPPSESRRLSSTRSLSNRPSLSNLRQNSDAPEYTYDQDSGTFVAEAPEQKAFSHLGRIHRESRGLADLAEEEDDLEDTDGEGSFDVVDWDDAMTDVLPARSEMSVTEYESIPAVGGGVISRPRVYHSSSLLHQSSSASSTVSTARTPTTARLTSPALQRLSRSLQHELRPSLLNPRSNRSSMYANRDYDPDQLSSFTSSPGIQFDARQRLTNRNQYVDDDELSEYPFGSPPDLPPLTRQQSGTAQSSSNSTPSTSAVQLDARSETAYERLPASRRASISSRSGQGRPSFSTFSSPYSDSGDVEDERKIVLRPGINNAVSQLSLLNRSNQTLSPFTRPLNHFMIRSVPPKPQIARRESPTTPTERPPLKAKRKRTFRLGGKGKDGGLSKPKTPSPLSQSQGTTPPESSDMGLSRPVDNLEMMQPSGASDFDAAEMDRYFHPRDEFGYSPHLRGGGSVSGNSPHLMPHRLMTPSPPPLHLHPQQLRTPSHSGSLRRRVSVSQRTS